MSNIADGPHCAEAPEPPQKRCVCVGIRSCALCLDSTLREASGLQPLRKSLGARNARLFFQAPSDSGDGTVVPVVRFEDGTVTRADELPVPFEGFELIEDVIESEAQEAVILHEIDRWPWVPSQSGRFKQDFGPRANFKKQRLKVPEDWQGIPRYAHEVLERLRSLSSTDCLSDFQTAEFLTLRYDVENGSNHALHVDDTWLWGERIVGVSLGATADFTFFDPCNRIALRVHLPRRSAYIMSGRSRLQWQHGFFAEDIHAQRFALTFRELTPGLAVSEIGQRALEIARGIAEPPPAEASTREQVVSTAAAAA